MAPRREEQQFLGYEYSERMGYEGLRLLSGSETIETPLFDQNDRNNSNKVAYLIRTAFEGGSASVPQALAPYCRMLPLHDLIDFDGAEFGVVMRTERTPPRPAFVVPTAKLGVLCNIAIGGTPSRNRPQYFRDGAHLWATISDMKGALIDQTAERITDEAVAASSVKLVQEGTTLLSFKLSIGRTARAGAPLYTNEAIAALPPRDGQPVTDDYLFALFSLFSLELLNYQSMAGKKFGKSMSKGRLAKVDVPLLDEEGRKVLIATAADAMMSLEEKKAALAPLIWAAAPALDPGESDLGSLEAPSLAVA